MITTKLNQFIFNTIIKYLINKQTQFEYLFEISLISKNTFKVLQNIIITNSNRLSYNLNGIKRYINNNGDNEEESYKLKLIQFKDLEIIQINSNYKTGITDEIREKLKDTNLKRIHYLNELSVSFYNDDSLFYSNDYRNDGGKIQVSFESLELFYFWGSYPVSNQKEFIEIVLTDHTLEFIESYEFSFDIFKDPRYNHSNKLYISTDMPDDSVHINNLNGILDNKPSSIKSIIFNYQNTPNSFIVKSLNSKYNLRSLEIRNDDRNNDTPITNSLYGLSNNNTLNKLKIRKCCFSLKNKKSGQPDELVLLFNYLKSNSTISILGLEYYDITNSDQLKPLLQFNKITKLYCDVSNYIEFLNHATENKNILKLVIKNIPKSLESTILQSIDSTVIPTTLISLTLEYNSISEASNTNNINNNILKNILKIKENKDFSTEDD